MVVETKIGNTTLRFVIADIAEQNADAATIELSDTRRSFIDYHAVARRHIMVAAMNPSTESKSRQVPLRLAAILLFFGTPAIAFLSWKAGLPWFLVLAIGAFVCGWVIAELDREPDDSRVMQTIVWGLGIVFFYFAAGFIGLTLLMSKVH